ncbi:unnamed protein product [Protopolystoma xenopodis]|uniref:Uncharacterized protein n=1 Tax=Protopolystoma xenopodis TaxID=117903 RepID=A0A3S5AN48_9PLAT|nr:unnamed protein product [Protopolystoma xenopodis]
MQTFYAWLTEDQEASAATITQLSQFFPSVFPRDDGQHVGSPGIFEPSTYVACSKDPEDRAYTPYEPKQGLMTLALCPRLQDYLLFSPASVQSFTRQLM